MKKYQFLNPITMFLVVLLSACSSYTTENGMPAYHHGLNDESKGYTSPISGADKNTFHVLKGGDYAKDKDTVFYQGGIVYGAHPATFVVVAEDYGKDDVQGFYQNSPIPGSDGKTLQAITGRWVRDSHDVYSGTKPIHACDPATFTNLTYQWNVDSLCAYHGDEKIPDADAKTFVVINSIYAKDSKHVYTRLMTIRGGPTGAIPDADPASFHLINGKCQVCARDKDRCYDWSEVKNCDGFEKK